MTNSEKESFWIINHHTDLIQNILDLSPVLFENLSEKQNEFATKNHWLEGYSSEEGVRQMFNWVSQSSDHNYNTIPASFPMRWYHWLDSYHIKIFNSFAVYALNILSEQFIEFTSNTLSELYAADILESSFVLCRLISYPKLCNSKYMHTKPRANEHYDPSFLTLLAGSTSEGLQIKQKEGAWQALNTTKLTSAVTVGRWSYYLDSEQFKSQLHRVIYKDIHSERFSLQAFLLSNPDLLIKAKKLNLLSPSSISRIQNSYQNAFISYEPHLRWE